MLTRKQKFWALIVIVPLIILIGFILFLKLYFTSERLKALILPRIEASLNRTIQVEDVSLSIFPSFGIDLSNLSISNPDTLSFKKDHFLNSERILFSVKLLPLFKNQIDIKEIVIHKPNIYLEVRKDGSNNYSFGTQKIDSTPDTKIEIPKSASLLLNNFLIENANIEYLDLNGGTHFVVSGYNQKTKVKLASGEDIINIFNDIEIAGLSFGDTAAYLVQDLPVKSMNLLTYSLSTDKLNFDSCLISINKLKVNCTGYISNLMGDMELNLSFLSKGNELSSILSTVPDKMFAQKKDFESTANYLLNLSISGILSDTSTLSVKGKILLDNGRLKYKKLPKAITDISIVGDFERSTANSFLNLDKFLFKMGNNSFAGNVTIRDFDNPQLKFEINSSLNLEEIKDYYPLEEGIKLSGLLNGTLRLSGEVRKPEKITAQGKLLLKNISVLTSQSEIQNLNGEIHFNNEIINSKYLSFQIAKSDLETSFELKNYISLIDEKTKTIPTLALNLKSNLLRTEDILKKEESVESKTQEKTSSPFIIPDIVASVNLSVNQFEMERFTLTNLKGQLNIQNRLVDLNYLNFNVFGGVVKTEGKIEFQDVKEKKFLLSMDIQGVQANDILSKFTTFGNNLFGKLNMNAYLKGSVDDTLGLIPQLLSGNGNVRILDGKLIGYPIMQKISEYTGIAELKEVVFRDWTNNFTISEGKFYFKNLKVSAFNTDLISEGSKSFSGDIQMSINLKLSQELSDKLRIDGAIGNVVRFLKDKEGRVNLPLILSGHYKSPRISLNLKEEKKQIEEQVKQEFEKKKDEVKEKVVQEAEKLLDTVQQKGAEELKKKAEDALKKLFRKP